MTGVSERVRTLIIVVVVAVMAALSMRFGLFAEGQSSPGELILNRSSAGWPDRPHDAEDEPLGSPPEAEGEGSFAFIGMQDDGKSPVTYGPCAPIHLASRVTPPDSVAAAAQPATTTSGS